MTKIRNLISVAVALLLTMAIMSGPVVAQELAPEHLALARKYVDLTDRAQIFEVTVVQTGINTMQTLASKNPEVVEQLDDAISETIKSYRPRKDELMNEFARIYALRFTTEELEKIVAFYASDVGQKLSKENFDANKQLSTVMNIFQQNLRVEFLASVRGRLKEMGIDI